ncbi:hypothetical protein [Neomoorella thermoacetica]|uniref:hypothetical protein n=1 Tax=Neomoorella thermoacetica TaxID=1525 RepID=UPI0008FB60DE|nr:hypothetical protein [Moorella thermoacetica]APC09060.1 hypothetical protein MTJW_19100 [Moorella thermoacetica]OIQ54993.1 hypothetical protein MORE_07390 [Moorella thermoacetica]
MMKCTCGGELKESKGIYDEGDLFVTDVPAYKCQKCGKTTLKPEAVARIKEVISEGGFYPYANVSYEELYCCFKCEKHERVKADWEIAGVTVKNVPSLRCVKCGTVSTDLKIITELEKTLEQGNYTGEVEYEEIARKTDARYKPGLEIISVEE